MSAMQAYGRLVWRPMTAVNLFAAASMAIFAVLVVLGARDAAGAEPGEALWALLLVAAPAVLGCVAAFPAQELFLAPLAWTLPRLRARLGAGLATVGVLACAGTVGGLAAAGELRAPVAPALGLAALAYGLGAAAFDPLPSRWRARLALLSLFALLALSGWTGQALAAAPIPATAAGLALGAWLGAGSVSRRALASRATARPYEIGLSFRKLSEFDRWRPALPGQRAEARPPRVAPDAARPWTWVRAALFEGAGWARGGWWRAAALQAVLLALVVAVLAFQDGLQGAPVDAPRAARLQVGLAHVHGALAGAMPSNAWTDPAATLLPLFVAVVVFFGGASSGLELRPGLLRPLSRRDLAEVTWRIELVRDLTLVAFAGAALLVASEAARASSDFEPVRSALPNWARACAVALLLAPLAQHLRRRWIDPHAATSSQAAVGLRIGLLALAVGWPARWICDAWEEARRELPALAWWALALLLLAGAQRLSLEVHRRVFASRDLV